jgi:hypothetical protein
MLSIVDLIEAGTMSREVAAYSLAAIGAGASFMVGALPGGAGKTTVMGALLNFVPLGVPLVAHVWEGNGAGKHRLVFDGGSDSPPGGAGLVSVEAFQAACQTIDRLQQAGARRIEDVRATLASGGAQP